MTQFQNEADKACHGKAEAVGAEVKRVGGAVIRETLAKFRPCCKKAAGDEYGQHNDKGAKRLPASAVE